MAHEILSAKLCELDQRIGRLHSRIQLSETGSWEEIQREVASMRRECEEERRSLQNRMRYSRFRPAARIAGAVDEIVEILERTRNEVRQCPENGRYRELLPEEKILLAEYMLDFALQAADQSLLASLEAIAGQMAEPFKEEAKTQ